MAGVANRVGLVAIVSAIAICAVLMLCALVESVPPDPNVPPSEAMRVQSKSSDRPGPSSSSKGSDQSPALASGHHGEGLSIPGAPGANDIAVVKSASTGSECPGETISEVRSYLNDIGVDLPSDVVIPKEVCGELRALLRKYHGLQVPFELQRTAALGRIAKQKLQQGQARIFIGDAAWKKAIRKDGEEDRLRRMGIKPRSEAPGYSARKEHQTWFSIGKESPGFPKSPYYPATFLVEVGFGEHREVDEPLSKCLDLRKQCAMQCALLVSSYRKPDGRAK